MKILSAIYLLHANRRKDTAISTAVRGILAPS